MLQKRVVYDFIKISPADRGRWVAISKGKVVVSGRTLRATIRKAKRQAILDPVFSKVPKEDSAYIL